MQSLRDKWTFRVRIEDDKVGVRTLLQTSLGWIQPEDASRGRAAEIDPSLEGHLSVNDTLVHERQPRLDARESAGDLSEVAPSAAG